MHKDISITAMNFEAKISFHEVTKSNLSSQTINKSPMVQQKSYKYFWIELSTIPLNVYESLEKLGTMGATSRTGITSVIYKFRL